MKVQLLSLRDKRMALRDGIDTDYDEGDQCEEETVRYHSYLSQI